MESYGACTSGTSRVLPFKFEALIPAPAEWSAVYDEVYECTEHGAERNSLLAMPIYGHTRLLQEYGWEVIIHHTPYSPDLAPRDFQKFLYLKKLLSGQRQRFQNDRGGDESHSCSNPRRRTSTAQDTKVGSTVWKMSQFRRWYWKIAQYLLYLFQ